MLVGIIGIVALTAVKKLRRDTDAVAAVVDFKETFWQRQRRWALDEPDERAALLGGNREAVSEAAYFINI